MKRCREFAVSFKKIYKATEDYVNDVTRRPVERIIVEVWSETVDDAIQKAWKSVTVGPEDYEIVSITTPENGYRIRTVGDYEEG